MIAKTFMVFLAIIFPFVALLIKDKPGAGLMALALQASILGWPIAIIWALVVVLKKPEKEEGQSNA